MTDCRRLPHRVPIRSVACWLALAAACASLGAWAQEDATLPRLINDYRSSARPCDGTRLPATHPLEPSQALGRVQVADGVPLGRALEQAGYRAAASRLIWVSGAHDAQAVMDELIREHCRALLEAQYTQIGVSHSGRRWRVVLARPLLDASLGDWRAAGRMVLARINTARAEARRCGARRFAAAAPLAWNDRLAQAALLHSRDMAERAALSHEGGDGSAPAQRATRQGYDWRAVGENVAGGQGSAEKVVAVWLASPPHCANIMSPEFTEMGAAYATAGDSSMGIYWTQLFAAPR